MGILHQGFVASIASGLCVTCATMVIVDFVRDASARYRERFLKEASVELDDVLLQMPAGRILDFSLALSAISGFLFVAVFGLFSSDWSWSKALFLWVLGTVGMFPIPRFYLRFLRKRRLKNFNIQLEDALGSMSSALKAGFSINQALETVVDLNKRPISVEFRLLLQEIRLGVPLEKALDNMNNRMQSADFELVATAIITARQTGGELTAILERLAAVIRERARIAGKIDALTAQGKMQATIIGIMPFALMFMMMYVAPDTMSNFFNSIVGILCTAGAVVMVITGFFVIKKITTIDI